MTFVLAAICVLFLVLIDKAKWKQWHEDRPLTHINDDYIKAFQKRK